MKRQMVLFALVALMAMGWTSVPGMVAHRGRDRLTTSVALPYTDPGVPPTY